MTADQLANVENSLVNQKDAILLILNTAESLKDVDGLERADFMLRFVESMWSDLGYGYKTRELRVRLETAASLMLADAERFLATLRKNAKVGYDVETRIRRLNAILGIKD
jgi:hypothetical protein